MRLPENPRLRGVRLTHREETGSTNDDALRAARAGDRGPHWFTASAQATGRGRHGRPWVSPPGNLHASLLLVDPCEPARASQIGFVAGLALHDAVRRTACLNAPRLALKWPNDLLIGPAKAAGILVEGHRLADGAFAVVIGIGADVAHAPEGLPYPTAALGAEAPGLDAGTLFSALAEAFAERRAQWAAGEGFEALQGDWLARAAGLGGVVTLRTPTAERSGRFLGLDPTGRLRLQTPSGVELVDAGDLSFPDTNREPNPAREPTRMTI